MQRVLIDTNVVVSFLHRRSASQQARAATLFTAASRRELDVAIHQHVLTETVYVLMNVYALGRQAAAAVVGDLLALPGIVRLDDLRDPRLLELWPARIPDFGDAVVAAVAHEQRLPVATFDRRFRKQLERLNVDVWSWQ